MKAIDCPFTKIINGTAQFVIPVFQRDYRWEEHQCRQLWRDVMRASQSGVDRGHFLGSVVYISTGDTAANFTRWLLIDGQQRLTTLTLLLTALRDHIRDNGWTGDENDPTAKRIDAYFLQNVQEDGARRQKLVLRREDQETLNHLIVGADRPASPSRRILENYLLFRELVADADPRAVYTGIGRLVIVDVSLDRQADDPQLVFESLNSTGVDLSQSDLIRNFILMKLPEADQTKLYNNYWSKVEGVFRSSESAFDAFARDYIALKTRTNRQERADNIYFAFRNLWDELKAQAGGFEQALAEILRFAGYHAAFSLGRYKPGSVLDALNNLRKLVDVPAILIMRLMDCHERRGTLSEDQFIDVLNHLESYVLRRAVCRGQTRNYWQVFANLAYNIDEASPADSLKVSLARMRESSRFPTDEDFRRALETEELYHQRVCRYLLERIENFNTREPSPTHDLSIEHILPQNENLPTAWKQMLGADWRTVQKTWLHRLGNLTLTAYNAKYKDRPFEEKKTIPGGFADSAVRLNKYVREQAKWTEEEIAARNKELADKAITIWPALVVSSDLLSTAKSRELRQRAAGADVSNVKMDAKAASLFSALRAKLSEIGEVIEVAEAKSVSYHAPEFFVEVLPRRHYLTLILALEFSEVEDPPSIVGNAADWKFFLNAKHSGGTYVSIHSIDDIERAIPIIKQAFLEATT
jgi:uncharacterized protein with ParB-like and HNH nuclease domain/predicted transport protein